MNLAMLNICLSEIDEDFDCVNYGGCGCVASMIATVLRPVFPIMRITSCGSYCCTDLDVVRTKLKDSLSKRAWTDNGLELNHVWVEVFIDDCWYALDSEGVKPIIGMYERWGKPLEGSFTYEEIKSLAATDSWNSTFDRSQLPAINEAITNGIGALL